MCTWITERTEVAGSAKGPGTEWLPITRATVYFDHPQDAPFDHALNIDFTNDEQGPSARVAIELSAESARALVASIESALSAGAASH